ncbi:MAG TPA: leucyl aminopeptidase [Beijerinckiaceae bacterium]|nr:leucyl aminopeptidase [Beijerinckiaceae bacterium]
MSAAVEIEFVSLDEVQPGADGPAGGEKGTLVVFAAGDLDVGPTTSRILGSAAELVHRAAATAKFKGRASSALDILAPVGVAADRLLVIGTVPKKDPKGELLPPNYPNLGGFLGGKLGGTARATVVFEFPKAAFDPAAAADFAMGLKLRAYKFDLYKTRKKEEEDKDKDVALQVRIAVSDVEAVRARMGRRDSIAQGVMLARTLVNEPANVLYPAVFAERTKELQDLGVEVEILDEPAMERLGMRALLGVGQGSTRESRLVVMRWNGAGADAGAPLAFLGKGVCFDTGGISIKPAANMEDMKGDMAGAACVVGLMWALAARKAKVNVVGAIGLVENMPSGDAQRPGDIVKSMSGQTIEIINTDAEGRLVLADVLWYIQEKYKPRFMINLATLTGAILIALGTEYAGLFSNNDELSAKLTAAGEATGEKVWRMPLAPAYDKLLDSKFADMKNVGGRNAGSITAAQFLQRFVNDVPWAHLDIAGTGMSSPQTDINQSWGSGWGVRLLDHLVADQYEN